MVAISGSWGRLAPSLVTMVNEADRIAPNRSIRSDGSLGDTSHAARSSFHNPLDRFVDALDLTHDPANGWDAHARARELVARGDARLDHVISNRQIWSAKRPYWRHYTGVNPHDKHSHTAVKRSPLGRNGTGLWWPVIEVPEPPPKPDPLEEEMPVLRRKGTDDAIAIIDGDWWMSTDGGIRSAGEVVLDESAWAGITNANKSKIKKV